MPSWKEKRFAGAFLGVLGLISLWASGGFGAPDTPGVELRTAVFFVA